jgi:DNA-binding CsgD family transcriptional regulator/PAS domain-containing protein
MSRFDYGDLPRLLERLHDAALDPHKWPDFLNALPQSFGGARGIIHLCAGGTLAFINFGNDPAYEASYAQHFAKGNPYPAIGFHKLPLGKVIDAAQILDTAWVERTEFFNDWMKPQGITCDHLAVSLSNDQRNVMLLSIAPHASVHLRQLELLTPHLMRAVEINRAMAGARRSNLILDSMLDALGRAVFVLDRHGKVLDANAHAHALMRGEDRPVHIDRFRVLHAGRREDDRTLSASVAGNTCATRRAILPMRLMSNRTGAPYLAWLIPIAPPKNGAPSQRQSLVEAIDDELTILLLVSPVMRSAEIPPEAIQAAFGLSAAEARLASALAGGRSLGDYAAQAGVSRNTVRNQLAAVFDKMGMRRGTELVATIVGALAPVGGHPNGQV